MGVPAIRLPGAARPRRHRHQLPDEPAGNIGGGLRIHRAGAVRSHRAQAGGHRIQRHRHRRPAGGAVFRRLAVVVRGAGIRRLVSERLFSDFHGDHSVGDHSSPPAGHRDRCGHRRGRDPGRRERTNAGRARRGPARHAMAHVHHGRLRRGWYILRVLPARDRAGEEVRHRHDRAGIVARVTSPRTFILVHGAWHGAWCWKKLTPLLEAGGVRVIAPDLPSMGADITPPNVITLDYWARFIADIVEREPEPVTLVAHSRGGIVASRAAELAPERIRRIVYVAAYLLPARATLAAE